MSISTTRSAPHTGLMPPPSASPNSFPPRPPASFSRKKSNTSKEPLKTLFGPLSPFSAGRKCRERSASSKIWVNRRDKVIIGGGMAFTFLKAKGMEIGNSLVENDMLDFAKGIEEHALSRGVKFYLPVDCIVAASHEPGAESKIVPVQEIPKGWYALDIGPASVKLFNEAVQNAKTILWNGPMGVFEIDAYARGTLAMAHAIADAYALTIVGGGETALAVHRAGESENMSFISTGGGAALELLEGKQLPGLTALPIESRNRLVAEYIPSITIETPVRRPLIVGNWKMNKTASEAASLHS